MPAGRGGSRGGDDCAAAGSVVVFDINPDMLKAGRAKAQQQNDLAGGWVGGGVAGLSMQAREAGWLAG